MASPSHTATRLAWFTIGCASTMFSAAIACGAEPANDSRTHVVEDFESGLARWEPTDDKAWRAVMLDAGHGIELFQQSDYKPPFRSPVNINLLRDVRAGSFELTTRVRTTTRSYGHRDVCFFFGYQDPAHFYYVHLGQKADDHANQIFVVDGAPRTKISLTSTDGTPWNDDWHRVKLARDLASGAIDVFFDDFDKHVMTARDTRFGAGRLGIGSFDDTAQWDDLELRYTP